MILHLDECIIEGNFIEERRREQPKGRWSSCGRFPVVSPVGGLAQGNKLRIRISTPSVSASVPAQNSLVRSSTVQGKCRSIEERMIEDEENEDCNFRFDQSIKSLSSVKFVDKRLSGGLGLWDRGIEGSPFGFSRGDRMGVWDGLDYRDCKEGKESKETKEGGDCKESSTRRSEPENYNETRNLHLKAKDHTEISNNPSKQTSNTKSTPQLNSPSNPPNQLTKPTTKPQISQMAHKTSSLTYSNPFTLSRPNEKILTTPQFSIPREDPQFANVTISELSLASEHEDLENPPLLTTQDPRDCQIPTILKSALSKKRNRLLTRHPSLNSLGTLNYRIEIDHPDLPQYCLKAKDLFDSYEFYQSVLGSLC